MYPSFKYTFQSVIRIFWLFVGILVTATAIFTAWFAYSTYKVQSNVIVSSLESEGLRLARTWLGDVDYVAYQMEVLGKQIKEGGADNLQNINTVLAYSKVERRINNSITWNMFSWADAKHQILVDAELGILKTPKDISMRDYIPLTKQYPWKIHLGTPVHGAVSHQWLIPAGMGYTDKHGNYIGAIVFGFEVRSLITKLERLITNPSVSFFMFDGEGNLIASSRNAKMQMQQWLLYRLNHTTLLPTNGIVSTQSLFDSSVPYAYRTALGGHASIITVYDPSLAAQSFLQGLAARVIELIVVMGMLLLLLGIFWQRFIKPVLALSNAATAISQGNMDIHIPRPPLQELHVLARQLVQIMRYIKRNKRIQRELTQQSQELVAAYAVAEEANQMKRRFLANMSHELRTPLNAINGFSEIIMHGFYGPIPVKYTEAGKAIHTASNHLLKLINELLDFSKIEAGKMELHEGWYAIEELFEACKIYIAPMAEEKKLRFVIAPPEHSISLYCDAFRLKQVILNLLSNALKFTPQGGTISLSAYRKEERLIIEVRDTGIGIAEEDIPVVLSEFSQVKRDPHSVAEQGTGLGLTIAKHLIEMHQGTLTLTSRVGEGTTIYLLFLPNRIKIKEMNNFDSIFSVT